MEGGLPGPAQDVGLNAVPRLGKKAALPRAMPSFTSNYLPDTSLPRYLKAKEMLKRAPAAPEAPDMRELSWHLGKRAPWTGAWANVMWKPDAMQQPISKRMAVPSDWEWGHVGRAPQGFRFADTHNDFLTRDLLFKRSEANFSGDGREKRVPEMVQEEKPEASATTEEKEETPKDTGVYRYGQNFVEESAIYPRDREGIQTILSRIQ